MPPASGVRTAFLQAGVLAGGRSGAGRGGRSVSQPASPAKVCVRCGQDCSDRPRVKDVSGRYCCKACESKKPAAASERAAEEAPWDAGLAGTHHATAGAAVPVPAADPLPDDGLNPIEFEPPVLPESSMRPCMGCGMPMQPGAVICVACGVHQATGQAAGLIVSGEPQSGKPVRACRKCGYDLAGLKTPKCPECGTMNYRRKRGLDLDREAAAKAYKWDYYKPLIVLGACGAIEAAILLSNYRGMELLEATLIVLARVPVGVAAYFACAFAWLGFDSTLKLTLVKLLGVFAAVSLATTICLLIPFGFYRLSISFFVQVWMLSEMMDMEYSDAAFVSAITSVAMVAAYFGVVYTML